MSYVPSNQITALFSAMIAAAIFVIAAVGPAAYNAASIIA